MSATQDPRSVESFGWEWTQRQVFESTQELYRKLFTSRGVFHDYYDGKVVADVGSGMGRATWALCRFTKASKILSIDLSAEAVAKQKEYITDPRVEFRQGDIAKVKFKADVIYCAGVIQHTADPKETVRNLVDNLNDGGELLISFYLRTTATMALEPLRTVLKRLPKEALWAITPALAPLFLARPEARASGFKTAMHNAYDWFGSHEYQYYFTSESIRALFRDCGIDPNNMVAMTTGVYRVRKGGVPLHLDGTLMPFPPTT